MEHPRPDQSEQLILSSAVDLSQTSLPWYVVHTRSRHEVKVQVGLCGKGLETFLPLIKVRSRRRDRCKYIHIPLFPGYLFVHTHLKPEIYHDILKTVGVARIVGFNNRCLPVEPGKVEAIQLMLASGRPLTPWQYLTRGKRVRIVEGPLAGAEGIILQRRDKKRRLVVAIELLQRSVAVELEEEAVEPLRDYYRPQVNPAQQKLAKY
ncbi:MAG: UpxY family transcription antiterminator [Desulfobacca sp.]|nr:UpxY family transcription antiterminator [Desulfobacca sp.]